MEYYNGEDTTLLRYDTGKGYEIVPQVNKLTCYAGPSGDFTKLPTLLPDLSSWTYVGTDHIMGESAYNFETTQLSPAPSNLTSTYNFFVDSKTGNPLLFQMKGYNIIWGAHPDIYLFVFQKYQPGVAPASAFTPPSLCGSAEPLSERRLFRQKDRLGFFHALHPVRSDDPFDHYAVSHNKVYANAEERAHRRSIWAHNLELINEHNEDSNKATKLTINRFGDLTSQERRELMGIKVGQFDGASSTHKYKPSDSIPASVDWRTKGAVTEVKDQGVCGSCWTFGSAAALEGAYAIKYRQLVEFSEQQFLDCAYVYNNFGCDGGNAYAAYAWLMTSNGLSTEKGYPYRMQDSFCKPVKKGVNIASYVNVTSGDELALQNAVATVGPVTVAINTMDPLWYFHTGDGVYDSDNCPGGIDDLDHQVTVVGYGTTDAGIDYWIVKNSYGPFWGDRGYIKMRRNHNNLCGIATQPNYVVF
jgi:C1A family cysteine protease